VTERFAAIVQARVGSTRLPGKVLRSLAGQPVILHVVERLRRVEGLDGIVVSVPDTDEDRPLIDLLSRNRISVDRWPGDVSDLLGRYLAAAHAARAEGILMVDSDCPLLDPDTAARMIAALRADRAAEYVRIEPAGIEGGVACLRRATFARIDREGAAGPEREHATLRILEHPECFRIVEIAPDPCFADPADAHRFWLDTPADARFLETVYERLWRPGQIVDLRDVVRLLRNEPALRSINAHVRQRNPRNPGRLVALLPTDSDPSRSFFRELGEQLAEQCRIGIRILHGPTAVRDALQIGPDCIVLPSGDPRAGGSPGVRCEIEPEGSIPRATEKIHAVLARAPERIR